MRSVNGLAARIARLLSGSHPDRGTDVMPLYLEALKARGYPVPDIPHPPMTLMELLHAAAQARGMPTLTEEYPRCT
jgi:hypothetical protein